MGIIVVNALPGGEASKERDRWQDASPRSCLEAEERSFEA